jgi:ferritin-like metal-binding protein YciE
LTENSSELLKQLLADAAAVERSGERRWRKFAASTGDDDEVRSLFEAGADSAMLNGQRVRLRLEEMAAIETAGAQGMDDLLEAGPQIGQNAHSVEERLLYNLIFASAEKAGHCALYKCLSATAAVTGDVATAVLAQEIEENDRQVLESVGRLLPSRSKIAFNMLTVSEVDPAVETKAKDDRIES